MTHHEMERRARQLAVLDGGRIAYIRTKDGTFTTVAYLRLTQAKKWNFGLGLFTGDLLDTYADHYWREYAERAKALLKAEHDLEAGYRREGESLDETAPDTGE